MRYCRTQKIIVLFLTSVACLCLSLFVILSAHDSSAKLSAEAEMIEAATLNAPTIDLPSPSSESCPHSWSPWYPIPKTDCKSAENEMRNCSICGKTEKRHNDDIGHKMVTFKDEPTCIKEGIIYEKCGVCDQNWHYIGVIPKRDHEFTTEYVSPTCSQGGCTKKRCIYCSMESITDWIVPLGHNFSYKRKDDRLYEWMINDTTHSNLFFRTCARDNCDCGYNDFDVIKGILQAWYNDHNYHTDNGDFTSPVNCVFFSHHDHDIVTDYVVSPTCVSEGYLQTHCDSEFCEDCFDDDTEAYDPDGEFRRAEVLKKEKTHTFVYGTESETCEHGAYNYLECNGCHQRVVITREDQGNVLFVGNGDKPSHSTSGSSVGSQSITPVGENGCDTPESLSYVAYVIEREIKKEHREVVFDENGLPIIIEHISVVVYNYEIKSKDLQAKEHTVYNADKDKITKGDESLKSLLGRLAAEFKTQREEAEADGDEDLYTKVIPVVLSAKDYRLIKEKTREASPIQIESVEDDGIGGFGDYGEHIYSYKPVFNIRQDRLKVEDQNNGDSSRPPVLDYTPILPYLIDFQDLSRSIQHQWLEGMLSDDSIKAKVEFETTSGQHATITYNEINEIIFTRFNYNEDGTINEYSRYDEVIPACMYDVSYNSVCTVCNEEVFVNRVGEHTEHLYTNQYMRNPDNENKLMLYRRHYCSCGKCIGEEWLTSQAALICTTLQEILDTYYIYVFGFLEGLVLIIGVLKGVEYVIDKDVNGRRKTRNSILKLIGGVLLITVIFAIGGKIPLLIMEILNLG